jgi:hypothetical protein
MPTIATSVAAISCTYWLFVVKDERVHEAAKRYEEQFFKSLTLLKTN